MKEYKVLKNNVTIVLNEEWDSSNEYEGIPLLTTQKRIALDQKASCGNRDLCLPHSMLFIIFKLKI